jgi:hypothetical protein
LTITKSRIATLAAYRGKLLSESLASLGGRNDCAIQVEVGTDLFVAQERRL